MIGINLSWKTLEGKKELSLRMEKTKISELEVKLRGS